jgi:uncharacterized sporulation protein YeaH/YhbH (DUF444 family)
VPRTAGEENSAGGALLQLYRNYPPAHQTLWREYEHLQATFDNFAMQHIRDQEDIYPVFRELFHKQSSKSEA